MVEVGGGRNRGAAQILITRLAVMITALLVVVLAITFRLSAAHAHAPIHAASAAPALSATVMTKYTGGLKPPRPVPAAAATPVAPAPTTTSAASTATTVAQPSATPTTAAPVTTAATESTAVTPPATPIAPASAAANPSVVAALVLEVEQAGIEPGPNWSWSMGNTSTSCGAIPDAAIATGCTSGAAGAATTVFTGSPTLALVAHELANAETENDAVPSLVAEVSTAEGGTSWSPIDAVASCLVEHFMGFQDNAAGTWQCPASLASTVAADIHDTTAASTAGTPG